MSDMTPMKRFTDQISKFEHLIGSQFQKKTFNKSAPKSNWANGEYYTSKGIANDFVIIFNTPFENLSFALTFQYINLKPEEQQVFASVKKGFNNDDIVYSEPLNLTQFKDIINNLNKELYNIRISKNPNIDPVDIIEKFSSHFLEDTLNLKELLKSEKEHYAIFLKDKTKEFEIEKFENKLKERSQKLKDTQLLIDTSIQSSADYKELQKLKKRLNELNNNIEEATDNLMKEHNFDLQIQLVQVSEEDLRFANMHLGQAILEYKTGANSSVSKNKHKR